MSITVVGSAASTSVGYTLEPALAAMGANLANFTEATVRGPTGAPVTIAPLPLLTPEMPRGDRLVALLELALEDLDGLIAPFELGDLPIVLGVATDLETEEAARLKATLDRARVVRPADPWAFPFGRASGFAAIRAAAKLITAGEVPLIVVGAVDSLCAPDTLRKLVQQKRILGPGTEGTIPGEAAAMTLLTNDKHPAASVATALRLEALALRRAATPFLGVNAIDAEALTATFKQLRESGAAPVDRVIAAHSGEGYFGRSFAHAYLRQTELMPEPLEVEITAERLGDTGAASALLGIAFASYVMAREADRRRVLVYTESDSGEIGAAILEGRPTWRRS
jgi:3-oxoacyl-[acyl-carrier-protein] synthase-1